MRFADLMADRKFVLVVSLPANDLTLAKAALEGGADAVKVHCNVWHRASGRTFGTYRENREFLRELIGLCGDVPVGLVPGTAEVFISEAELKELEELGLDFISAYSQNMPTFVMDSVKITSSVAIGSEYDAAVLDELEYGDAVNLILSHEYYHYLEMNEIGLASRDYLVPMLEIGHLKLGKTGIRALSEVGAHAFARKYYELVTERKQRHEATEL